MSQQENNSQQALNQSAQSSVSITKGGVKVVKGVVGGVISLKVVLVVIIVFLFFSVIISLTASTSASQMNDTYYLSIKNGEKINRPSDADRDAALNDQERAREKTAELLDIVMEIKQKDLEKNIKGKRLKKDCRNNGWDYNLTLSHAIMDSEVISVGTSSNNSNNVKASCDISGISARALKTFTCSAASEKSAGASKAIYESQKTSTSTKGLYRFDSGCGSKDYLVKMGAYFGGTGNRYLITFDDGSTITVLKAEEFFQSETTGSKGMALRGGGVLEFLISPSANTRTAESAVSAVVSGKSIQKIDMLGSEFLSQRNLQMSTTDSRVLAAFSVYLDNMELESVNSGLRKKIVNQRGDLVQSKWIWSDDEVDLDKSLRDILEKFLKKENPETGNKNSFYELDYKRDASGNIIVDSVDLGHYMDVEEDGEVVGQVWVPDIHYYATPIIIELDIGSIAEELYNLEPDGPYINSGGPYKTVEGSEVKVANNQTTIREAINTIAENTDAVLFNISGTAGEIIISELQGQLLWPSPGYTNITSRFGRRSLALKGASKNHAGIDIGSPYGEPVVAAEAGVITYAGVCGAGGNWVSIKHEKNIQTNYGHLSRIVVSVGQPVERGQVIAYSGNSGVSSGPHLHFEVVVSGNNVNPVPYVTQNPNDVTYS